MASMSDEKEWDVGNTVNQLYLAAIKFGVLVKVDLFGAF